MIELARGGSTVIFSTHVMQHAERLCDRIMLIARGRRVFQGTQREARAQLPARLTLRSARDPHELPGVETATAGASEDGWTDWEVALKPGCEPEALLELCTTRGFALRGFEIHRASLHDVFLHLVGEKGQRG